eukprot:16444730-Heterocapsa_arctica.AAC.1
MEGGKGLPPSDEWKADSGASWQRNQEWETPGTGWSWETPTDQEPGTWKEAGQQERQKEVQSRRPEPRVEEPEGQADQKQEGQSKGPADPRGPGGAMHGQPKRRGGLAPEDQVRGVEPFAKPGQFDEDSQEPDMGHDRKADLQQQQGAGSQDPSAEGKEGGKEGNEASNKWNGARKYQDQAAAAEGAKDGNQDPVWEGVPAGSERIEGINGYRTPENDFMFHMGWIPQGDEWNRAGRDYLTEHSQHARE